MRFLCRIFTLNFIFFCFSGGKILCRILKSCAHEGNLWCASREKKVVIVCFFLYRKPEWKSLSYRKNKVNSLYII